jgi:hypothetical protein
MAMWFHCVIQIRCGMRNKTLGPKQIYPDKSAEMQFQFDQCHYTVYSETVCIRLLVHPVPPLSSHLPFSLCTPPPTILFTCQCVALLIFRN